MIYGKQSYRNNISSDFDIDSITQAAQGHPIIELRMPHRNSIATRDAQNYNIVDHFSINKSTTFFLPYNK